MEQLPEILFVDKPSGMTSFDVIRYLRKRTGIKKFGHAGTLDPLATGLMIIGVETGTKKLTEFIKLDKEYIAEIRIGEERTTDDLEGDIVNEQEVETISPDKIEQALSEIVGTHSLKVSAYSAIKKDGKAMYKRAREAQVKGETIDDVPVRQMTVYEAQLLKHGPIIVKDKKRYVLTVRFHVESGVYIRSLAKEIGRLLGYPSTIQALRRTKIGTHTLEESKRLEDF